MSANQKLLLEMTTSADYSSYTIILSPGMVRYITVTDFLTIKIEEWIDLLRGLSSEPRIEMPRGDWFWPNPGLFSRESNERGFNQREIDELVPNATWDERLRIQHKIGTFYRNHGVPTCVYCSFHFGLMLKELRPDCCLESWIREAWLNEDLTKSFEQSPKHLVFETSSHREPCVFSKTPFVLDRLEDETAKKEAEDLARLRRSAYGSYVYVMEDLRTRHFKIGRSKTPGKRERTLQAEVPQIVLRFSIPADEEHERALHNQFADKRVRGEWFSLTSNDLLWIVSFLKNNGDIARASVDHQWLGAVCFSSSENHSAG